MHEAWVGLRGSGRVMRLGRVARLGSGYEAWVREAGVQFENAALSNAFCQWDKLVCCPCHGLR